MNAEGTFTWDGAYCDEAPERSGPGAISTDGWLSEKCLFFKYF